ncbi:MurR/RpiR family transcriptional regulator [Spiroplasma tabanidicola]|uniref:HTH rpiR-type domain-containing protein n=1 Tax=Spiroplasma tabanidicola TaxID=324079 RepID=A0A6I6C7F4_9MOLU|nr:MurR/RpiR family transcriptional regulator [Spiroplasma tabanidicola]QGS52140.1 hypothetical protein STABA_v1c07840 [Spiroplasma tabanidicola]
MKILKLSEDKLNSTEQAIVNEINNNPDYFCSHNIQEVSRASNVSSSTMTRVCQKLGFKSFKAAQMFVYEKSRMQTEYYKLGEDKTPEQVIHNVKGSALFTINETLNNLDPEYANQIAKKIYEARSIIVFGVEQQEVSANSFVQNLCRLNKEAVAVSNIHLFVQKAVFFTNQDFCVFVSRTGWTKEVIESAKWAINRGIPVLILTTDQETTLEMMGEENKELIYTIETQTLSYDKIQYPAISSLPGELIIFDVLFNIVVTKNKEYREKFQKTSEISLRWNFEGHL